MSARHRAKSPAAKLKRDLRRQRAQSLKDRVVKTGLRVWATDPSVAQEPSNDPFDRIDAWRSFAKACVAFEKFEKENPK